MSITLKAEKREQLGTAASRRLKTSGRIPAVIYAKDGNVNLSVDGREFEAEYFKGDLQATVVELDLDGKKTKVIAHKIEVDPVSDRPVHIDFFGCDNSKKIRAKAKIQFTNRDKSLGLKRGGLLNITARKVEVVCDNEKSIPQTIAVDAGSLHIGHKVRASDLNLPAGVKLTRKDNFLVASITGRGKSEEPAAGEAPAKGEAAAPEAAAKAA